jgi:hypothetical protein
MHHVETAHAVVFKPGNIKRCCAGGQNIRVVIPVEIGYLYAGKIGPIEGEHVLPGEMAALIFIPKQLPDNGVYGSGIPVGCDQIRVPVEVQVGQSQVAKVVIIGTDEPGLAEYGATVISDTRVLFSRRGWSPPGRRRRRRPGR